MSERRKKLNAINLSQVIQQAVTEEIGQRRMNKLTPVQQCAIVHACARVAEDIAQSIQPAKLKQLTHEGGNDGKGED